MNKNLLCHENYLIFKRHMERKLSEINDKNYKDGQKIIKCTFSLFFLSNDFKKINLNMQ